MTSDHRLPADDHDRIYARIKKVELPDGLLPAALPRAIITGGQPGSGKSGLTSKALEQLNCLLVPGCSVIVIDADRLRSEHPSYHHLLRTNDSEAANLTHPDAGRWASRLTDDAIAAKQHVVVDQTSRDPAALLRIAAKLRGAGYRTEFWGMAVPANVSSGRILRRYETQRQLLGVGRFSTPANHKAAYDGLPASIAELEQKRAVDVMSLFDQDHQPIYSNALSPSAEWARPAHAAAALQMERDAPASPTRALHHALDLVVVRLLQEGRSATGTELTVSAALGDQAAAALLSAGGLSPASTSSGHRHAGRILAADRHRFLQLQADGGLVTHDRNRLDVASGGKAFGFNTASVEIRYGARSRGYVRLLDQGRPELQR